MPINEGAIEYITRNMMTHSKSSFESMVAEAEKSDRRRRTETDVLFREFHEEAFGEYIGRPIPTYAQHALARTVFDIPNNLTETPVDRWMERLRG